jgi:phage-related minor tail protein
MTDEIETLLVAVRADTHVFARDVAAMKAELTGPFAAGAERAGRALETALVRALRTGKLGLEDLKRVALSVMAEIASAAIRGGLDALFKGVGGKSGGGLGALVTGLLSPPGLATGGQVSPGRPYLVGERGPELFMPTASGRIETGLGAGQGRAVNVSVTINTPAGSEGQALQASGRQVARAVRQALLRAGD